MAKKTKDISYWPHMILGFLIVGITLSYWTVKSASSIPVQEPNEYMMEYQQADIHINDILRCKANFDRQFTIEIIDAPKTILELENAKRAKEEEVIVLKNGINHFSYRVSTKSGTPLTDANITFLLTRPHTNRDNVMIENVSNSNGVYAVDGVSVNKTGRYILQLKAIVNKDTIGYLEIPAYLK
ncbi:MAG: FixH family protein [Sulfurovum sp.]|nr:FixH family protein [Sulfurovum sp.]MCB4753427.1 FixH family protein [Sulfurovum sp.]